MNYDTFLSNKHQIRVFTFEVTTALKVHLKMKQFWQLTTPNYFLVIRIQIGHSLFFKHTLFSAF